MAFFMLGRMFTALCLGELSAGLRVGDFGFVANFGFQLKIPATPLLGIRYEASGIKY